MEAGNPLPVFKKLLNLLTVSQITPYSELKYKVKAILYVIQCRHSKFLCIDIKKSVGEIQNLIASLH